MKGKGKSAGRTLIKQLGQQIKLETTVEVLTEQLQEKQGTIVRYAEAIGRLMSTGCLLSERMDEMWPDIDEAIRQGMDQQLAAHIRGFRRILYGLIPREKLTERQNAMAGGPTTGPPEEEEVGDAEAPGEDPEVVGGQEGTSEDEAEAPRDQEAE